MCLYGQIFILAETQLDSGTDFINLTEVEGLFATSIDFYSKRALLSLQDFQNICVEVAEPLISLILCWSEVLENGKSKEQRCNCL